MPRMAKIFLLLLLSACLQLEESGKLTFIENPRESLKPTINKRDFKGSINHNSDIALINNDYPLELRLYQNKKFYFNLPSLGEGEGNWEYQGSEIKLTAEYHIKAMDFTIDMNYFVGVLDEEGTLAVQFSDRFGPKTYKLEKVNLD